MPSHEYAVSSLGATTQQTNVLESAGHAVRLACSRSESTSTDYARMADSGDTNPSIALLRRALSEINTVIGVDRLDDSKGCRNASPPMTGC